VSGPGMSSNGRGHEDESDPAVAVRAWVNGEVVDPAAPSIAALDHGVTVGDGVFETCAVERGQAFALFGVAVVVAPVVPVAPAAPKPGAPAVPGSKPAVAKPAVAKPAGGGK